MKNDINWCVEVMKMHNLYKQYDRIMREQNKKWKR